MRVTELFDEPTMPLRTLSPLWGSGVTHRGKARPANEDVLLLEPTLGLFGVFDGMGGAAAGALAAEIAANNIAAYVRRTERPYSSLVLSDALRYGSRAVYDMAQAQQDCRGMGSTAVVCLADQHSVWIGHAGDSRAYLLRDGLLHQLTADHTLVQEMVSSGICTSVEEAATRRSPSILTLNLGHDPQVEPTVVQISLRAEDVLLLSSDGLHGDLPPAIIATLLGQRLSPAELASQLVAFCLGGPCTDNVSAVVLKYEP